MPPAATCSAIGRCSGGRVARCSSRWRVPGMKRSGRERTRRNGADRATGAAVGAAPGGAVADNGRSERARDRTAAPWRAISNGSGAEIMLARRTTSFGLIGPRSTLAPRPGGHHPIPGTRAIGPVGRVLSRAAPCPRDEGRRHELGLFGPHRREHDPPLRLDALPCGQHRHDGDPLELELRLNAQDAAHLRPVLEQLARDHTAGSRAPAARHVQVPSCRAEVSSISKRLAMPTVNLPPPQAPREYRRRNPASRLPLHSRRAKLRIANQTPRAKMAVAEGTSRLLRQPPGTRPATREPAAGERIEHGRISGEQSSSCSRRSSVARPRRTSSSPGRAFTGSTSCG